MKEANLKSHVLYDYNNITLRKRQNSGESKNDQWLSGVLGMMNRWASEDS